MEIAIGIAIGGVAALFGGSIYLMWKFRNFMG